MLLYICVCIIFNVGDELNGSLQKMRYLELVFLEGNVNYMWLLNTDPHFLLCGSMNCI